VVAAFALGLGVPWALNFALAAVIASLLLCVVGWPEARIGLLLNAVLLLALVLAPRFASPLLTP